MRCFEAIGCGALLLSDAGKYPEGMDVGETILTYETGGNCLDQIEQCQANWSDVRKIAGKGRNNISDLYSKERSGSYLERS
ncbi:MULTISPECIES: glycosyltransferase [unclassified Bradyrhizobium]|uniref:glycosyltransferase n=1 Tax=Bradyrhizobium sp. CCBAU 45394 TaxID=1325087 RepID=UPI002304B617|nr:glycosyltransferase [Bradyrhizobium sp. CCBAU 45394]